MTVRILIITNRHDLHADIVAEKLRAAGRAAFRIDLDRFPRDYRITFDFAGGEWHGEIVCEQTGDTLRIDMIGAVWIRKKGDHAYRNSGLSAQEAVFADGEMRQILFGLLYTRDCYWMSHPLALRGAMWKNEQLSRAARMGFSVPPSIVTDAKARYRDFAASASAGTIFKGMASETATPDQLEPDETPIILAPTTLIEARHEPMLDALETLPAFFQHYQPKRHEIRATIIGDRLFAARIHSQDDPRTSVDWRDYSAEILYEPDELPAGITARCIDFVHSYGLTFGAIDLIVTPDGDHVFLENNPGGQFLFVEQLIPSFDMTGALADCLIAGADAHG